MSNIIELTPETVSETVTVYFGPDEGITYSLEGVEPERAIALLEAAKLMILENSILAEPIGD
jgi:hypothetical protein